jgi:hypothetical protein
MKSCNIHHICTTSLKTIKKNTSPTVYNRSANYIKLPEFTLLIFSKIWTIFIDPSEKEYYGYKIKILDPYKAFKQYKDNL